MDEEKLVEALDALPIRDNVIQFRPKPNPNRERQEADLQRQMNEIMFSAFHGIPVFIDPSQYVADDKDPA